MNRRRKVWRKKVRRYEGRRIKIHTDKSHSIKYIHLLLILLYYTQ